MSTAATPHRHCTSKRARHTIVLVDQNRNVREYCIRELRNRGILAYPTRDYARALELVATPGLSIEAVVTDVDIPGPAFGEFLSRLWSRHVPVVVFTSELPGAYDERLGMVEDIVVKSGDLGALIAAIENAISKAAERANRRPDGTRQWDSEGID